MSGVSTASLEICAATENDVPLLLEFIRGIAEYEKLSHEVVATEASVRQSLFGARPAAEAIIARWDGVPAGFAVCFTNFSTFVGRPGLYLEDLFVKPEFRRHGIGRALFLHLARIAAARQCDRFEWVALDWNEPAHRFYENLGARRLDDWRLYRMNGEALARLAQS